LNQETNKPFGYIGVGWSDTSEQHAKDHALERARNIAANVQAGIPQREQYYADRPLREPVVDELIVGDQRLAAITQNIYGAYILNAARAMFIDIDTPAPQPPPGLIGRFLGQSAPPPPTNPIDAIAAAVDAHPGLGLRLYRTPNGYRALVTHQPYDPTSGEARRLLDAFHSDHLYTTLCKAQHCFRARLTPKPWRIGMDTPPRAFPFDPPAKRNTFEAWKADYDQRITTYAACEPTTPAALGNPTVHPDIEPVLTLHDQLACAPGKPLA